MKYAASNHTKANSARRSNLQFLLLLGWAFVANRVLAQLDQNELSMESKAGGNEGLDEDEVAV